MKKKNLNEYSLEELLSGAELKLTRTTPVSEMPDLPVWNRIKEAQQSKSVTTRAAGLLLNSLVTAEKVAAFLSLSTLNDVIDQSEYKGWRKAGLAGKEFGVIKKKLVSNGVIAVLREASDFVKGKENGRESLAAVVEVKETLVRTHIELSIGEEEAAEQIVYALAEYDKRSVRAKNLPTDSTSEPYPTESPIPSVTGTGSLKPRYIARDIFWIAAADDVSFGYPEYWVFNPIIEAGIIPTLHARNLVRKAVIEKASAVQSKYLTELRSEIEILLADNFPSDDERLEELNKSLMDAEDSFPDAVAQFTKLFGDHCKAIEHKTENPNIDDQSRLNYEFSKVVEFLKYEEATDQEILEVIFKYWGPKLLSPAEIMKIIADGWPEKTTFVLAHLSSLHAK